ncbi:MAG: xanthine dehydrogenase [Candidatus Parabeggiatoa sp. nov. 1]|nr:MAG: xanthine dehydrogenase [Gammaproteobacteria bacterium]
MKNIDTFLHVKGESQFTDDLIVPEGTLHAAVFSSSIAHGKITHLNLDTAKQIDGVYAILTADDILGDNQIGAIIPDEPLLATSVVHYIGQPIAVVIAKTADIARTATKTIVIDFEEYPTIFDARQAYAKGQLIGSPHTLSLGNIETVWKNCDVIVEGKVESGGQEHIYLETQSVFAYPTENEGLKVISSTQSPNDVQRLIAGVLNLPMHKIEVDVLRLGGGFGGKESQATAWAAMTALAAFKLKKPIKLVLRRDEDMRMTGKRHPYSSDFKMGLTHNGQILAYEVTFYQNAGAAADLSPAVLGRSLFHATNSYFIPHVKTTGYICRTNLPPNTAFRGFGTPQAVFVIESAIFKAAEQMDVAPSFIQKKNLLKTGDEFSYGMKVENSQASRCWEKAEHEIEKRYQEINFFNKINPLRKKGLAIMPICFGISFNGALFMNQANAIVHIYTDGSISVSTGAIEMGQGVNMKIRQVIANIFSIPLSRVNVESANTKRIANMSPTAASLAADLNGNATKLACLKLLDRLKTFAAKKLNAVSTEDLQLKEEVLYLKGEPTDLTWQGLIGEMYLNRVSLTAHSHYSIPNLYFDEAKEKGHPFAYHVFGTAMVEVTLDCLRGTYRIDTVKIVHDFGKSLNPLIDKGQVEGAVVQGIGWMTIEELMYANNGSLLTDTLANYTIPDIRFAPDIQVDFLENSENPLGLFNSKAVGEPPFLYGIGAYFAILQAMKAFRPTLAGQFSAPLTSEKVLLSLYEN